jgi:ParB family transcriptional regulator, chromosome partitioning protein
VLGNGANTGWFNSGNVNRGPRDSLGDLEGLASIVEFQLQPVVIVNRAAFQNIYPEAKIAARWVVIIGNRRLAAAQVRSARP